MKGRSRKDKMILEIEILIVYFVIIVTAGFVCKYVLWITNIEKKLKIKNYLNKHHLIIT